MITTNMEMIYNEKGEPKKFVTLGLVYATLKPTNVLTQDQKLDAVAQKAIVDNLHSDLENEARGMGADAILKLQYTYTPIQGAGFFIAGLPLNIFGTAIKFVEK